MKEKKTLGSRYTLYIHILALHKATYIVLELEKHSKQECGEEMEATRRGNYCVLLAGK